MKLKIVFLPFSYLHCICKLVLRLYSFLKKFLKFKTVICRGIIDVNVHFSNRFKKLY